MQPEAVRLIGDAVLAEARRLSGESWEMRKLMRKAHLPRLGKLLSQDRMGVVHPIRWGTSPPDPLEYLENRGRGKGLVSGVPLCLIGFNGGDAFGGFGVA